MITDHAMYRKAVAVLHRLEKLVKAGEATPEQRERYAHVRDHVLIWEWAQDGRPAVEVMPRDPEPLVDPVVLAFCDWWARVADTPRWAGFNWRPALLFWWTPRGMATLTGEIEEQVDAELARRDAVNLSQRSAA